MKTPYECPTCGQVLTLNADGWAWHRLVEHSEMGLPVHDPHWRARSEAERLEREHWEHGLVAQVDRFVSRVGWVLVALTILYFGAHIIAAIARQGGHP